MEKEINRYLKEIELIIPLNTKEKKEFISLLRNRILTSEIINYDELLEHFGKPCEVAASFIENMDTDILIQKLKKKKYVRRLIIIIIICIISVSLFEVFRLNQLYNDFKQQQPIQVETIIE